MFQCAIFIPWFFLFPLIYLEVKLDIALNEDIALGLISKPDQAELVDLVPELSLELAPVHGREGVDEALGVIVPRALPKPELGFRGG